MGFLDPANLLYAGSLALLVAIYLRARARPTIEVSSLLLFDELAAPVASSRVLRVDLLFWLELAALSALTLAIAGFYVRTRVPIGNRQRHAIIFDLGAAMGAVDDGATRLQRARAEARELISHAPEGDEFSIITYALEARTVRAASGRIDELGTALDQLRPLAVAARPAALRAAILEARGASTIELFASRPPPPELISELTSELGPATRLYFHQVGGAAPNLAIVSLDPGVPRSSPGRCVLRNFSMRPEFCELKIDAAGRKVFDSPVIVEPRSQVIVPFGPVDAGGLLHAHIQSDDALAADNDRYALAPVIAQARALVMSPDAAVRDDLARLVLAVNPNFIVTAVDSSSGSSSKTLSQHFDLAVLHDCGVDGVNASSRLLVFPEPWLDRTRPGSLRVVSSSALAELEGRAGNEPLATPVILGPSRVMDLPQWMSPLAQGSSAGEQDSFPLAAAGRDPSGGLGVVAFDIRHHLLLDPDRMDALVLVVDTLKQVLAPQDVKIVATGDSVAVATFGPTLLIAPDGSRRELAADAGGNVYFRPLDAGKYTLDASAGTITAFANYYDAAESDLAIPPAPRSAPPPAANNASARAQLVAQPATEVLLMLALLLLLGESAILARRAARWGMSHV